MTHRLSTLLLAQRVSCGAIARLGVPSSALAEKGRRARRCQSRRFQRGAEPVKIGKSVFYNERINTTGSGLVQVLLVDGSTFTVGPGSDLVIDKFVYDPRRARADHRLLLQGRDALCRRQDFQERRRRDGRTRRQARSPFAAASPRSGTIDRLHLGDDFV